MARSNGNSGHGAQGVPPAPARPAVPTWQGGPDPYAAFHQQDPRTALVAPTYPQPQPGYAPQQHYGYDPNDPAAYGQPAPGYAEPPSQGYATAPPSIPAYPQTGGWAPGPREPHPLNLSDFSPAGPPPLPQGGGGRLPMAAPSHAPVQQGWDPRLAAPQPDLDPRFYAEPQHGGYGQPAPATYPAPYPQQHQQPPGGYAQPHPSHQQFGQHHPGQPHAGVSPGTALAYPPEADQYEDEEEYFEEEPPSKKRSLMIVGALVGAICVGGGLAYAYKTFAGGPGGATPLLKAEAGPTKAKGQPSSGGKVAERFGETGPGTAVAAATDQDLGRPRTVPTQTISVTPPAANAPPPTAQSGVPGLVLDGGNLGPRPLPPVVPVAPAANAGGPAPVILPPARSAPPAAPPPVAAAAPPLQPVPKVVKAAPPPKAPDAFIPGGTTAVASAPAAKASLGAPPPSPAATGGNGFVAVVASQKDRLAAMKAFADLQQKYPAVLGPKLAEVQEVNLGEAKGGIWYRAVVGPPGSREAAAKVCADLRGAGMAANQCWATAY